MPKKSQLKKQEKPEKQEKVSQTEFEKKVLDLTKKDVTSEKIGEILRQQGIHSKDYSKTISQILKEKNLYINPDLKNIDAKLSKVKKHLESNKKDKRAKRQKDRIFSQLRKTKKYFKIPVK